MGHIRLGQLPRTRKWAGVIELIDTGAGSAQELAEAIAETADDRLTAIKSDPGLTYLFWLLTRITWSARKDDFNNALHQEGINIPTGVEGIRLLASLGQMAQREVRRRVEPNALHEIALRAFNESLSQSVKEKTNSLFGISNNDVQQAFRDLSNKSQFSSLTRSFFSRFVGGLFQFIVSKESSNHIGWNKTYRDSAAAINFDKELSAYAFQTTRILKEFSGDWYSKHNWLGNNTEQDASRFVNYAITKIQAELKLSKGTA